MRRKDESKKSVILDFIDEYYNEYNEIPAVRTIAEAHGESTNAFINRAIAEAMERDNKSK